jgi:hypothetical protein
MLMETNKEKYWRAERFVASLLVLPSLCSYNARYAVHFSCQDSAFSVTFSSPNWKPEQVKRLKIPILPLPIQQEIALLVQQSHEARKRAKELLEVAKRAVEIAIEKNEKEALDYISKSVVGRNK